MLISNIDTMSSQDEPLVDDASSTRVSVININGRLPRPLSIVSLPSTNNVKWTCLATQLIKSCVRKNDNLTSDQH